MDSIVIGSKQSNLKMFDDTIEMSAYSPYKINSIKLFYTNSCILGIHVTYYSFKNQQIIKCQDHKANKLFGVNESKITLLQDEYVQQIITYTSDDQINRVELKTNRQELIIGLQEGTKQEKKISDNLQLGAISGGYSKYLQFLEWILIPKERTKNQEYISQLYQVYLQTVDPEINNPSFEFTCRTYRVCEPQLQESALKKNVVYKIIDDQQSVVYRSLREVVLLREILNNRWPGIYLPPLIQKSVFDDFSGDNVENTRKSIEYFIIKLSRIPFFYNCVEFGVFINKTNKEEYKESEYVYKQLLEMNQPVTLDQINMRYKQTFEQFENQEAVNEGQRLKCSAFGQLMGKLEAIKLNDFSDVKRLFEINSKNINQLSRYILPDLHELHQMFQNRNRKRSNSMEKAVQLQIDSMNDVFDFFVSEQREALVMFQNINYIKNLEQQKTKLEQKLHNQKVKETEIAATKEKLSVIASVWSILVKLYSNYYIDRYMINKLQQFLSGKILALFIYDQQVIINTAKQFEAEIEFLVEYMKAIILLNNYEIHLISSLTFDSRMGEATYLSIMTILKAFLLDAKQQKMKDEYKKIKEEVLSNQEIVEKLNNDIQTFLNQLEEEVTKFFTFSIFKYQDLVGKQNKLKQQCVAMENESRELIFNYRHPTQLSWNQNRYQKFYREKYKNHQKQIEEFKNKQLILQDSYFRFIVEIQKLQEFNDINNEAIRKIIKKYKKQELRGIQQKHEELFSKICSYQPELKLLNQQLKKMKDHTESQIIQYFYKQENPKKCREYLRKYTQSNNMSSFNIFYFGFFAGFAAVFILILLVMRYDGFLDPDSDKVFNKLFPCFRGIALFLLYYWFLALDVAGWNYFNINYKLYLGFNFHYSTLAEILKRVTVLSSIFLITFVLYCTQEEDIGKLAQELQFFNPHFYPLIIWSVTLFYVFYPTKKHFNPQGRKWMYTVLYGTFWMHFFAYESRFTFMADQMCSFTTPLRDLDYTICYYYYLIFRQEEHNGQCNPRTRFTSALPATIPYTIKCIHYITRGRQKGKFWGADEMWNFFKTLNAVNVGVWSYIAKVYPQFQIVWIIFAVISTCWQYWWDVKKDFLFFEPDSKYKFLRNDLGYNSPKIYYALAVVNFFLRCTWVLSLSPDMYLLLGLRNELFILMVGILEMSRRLLNNFLKMEKEHITNLRSFKTIQDLKYPFKYQQEMKVIEESFRWSVSSFRQENSGFMSFDQALQFENQPELIELYRGISLQVPEVIRNSVVSNKSRNHQLKVSFIKDDQGDSFLEMPLISENQSRRQSTYKKLHNISNQHLCSLIENIQTPHHSRQASREQNTKSPLKGQENFQQLANQEDQLLQQKIDTALLDQAKKKERLEQFKINSLKTDNRKYKDWIEQLYIQYGVGKQ